MNTLAAWQQTPSIEITVAMASLGFDWIVVDMEHSAITTQEAEAIFIAAERHGAKPFVRLPSADPYLARRLLDGGAVGILVPVVESREQFDQFAEHCFYPPKGKRGLGLMRANLWGDHLASYFTTFSPLVIAQIETKKGAENIKEILDSPFLEGIMIGPYDLSASLGKPAQFDDPVFQKMRHSILEAVKKSNKMIGYHQVEPDIKALQACLQEGYGFVAYGTDLVALRYALKGIKK